MSGSDTLDTLSFQRFGVFCAPASEKSACPGVYLGIGRAEAGKFLNVAGCLFVWTCPAYPLLVTATFNIILGGVCLALALAFGLGGKDAAARYLEELKKKRSWK
jgi:hypothetical protein